jgi:hypothetical protein
MPYLGNQPFEQYSETKTQVLTGNGTVGPYTLDYEVGSVGDVEVFVNNVRQQGGSSYAYTVSGNQLTMTGAVASTDDFYVVFQGKSTPSGQISEKQSNGDYTFDDGTLFVDASTNRVGVNSTSPSAILEIDAASSNFIRFADSGTLTGIVGMDDGGTLVSGATDGDMVLRAQTSGKGIVFGGNGGSRFGMFDSDGIKFNSDTAAANALDDYEESSYVPAFQNGTFTYSNQYGWVVKIGSLVTVGFAIQWTAKSGSGEVKVSIPINTPSSSNFWRAMGSVGYMNGVDMSGYEMMSWTAGPNESYVGLRLNRDNNSPAVSNVSNMSSSGEIQGTLSYRIND